ncbi:MAG: DUF2270 domain-containing protein [Candidatus Aenigmarchaeota archaeon]|nr:DUF2270 domain-containing protein [Candidatus Aenigmarchaeota archaeon]
MSKIPLTDDSASRLYSQLYMGYVHNRNKEMDRIDNSTGWSVGILVLALSLMINAGIAYYLIPLSLFFVITFWLKEARRYIYYMFWSLKESELEKGMSSALASRHIDTDKMEEVVNLSRPLTVLSESKSLYVRFYRSYFWMVLIIYITTILMALEQGAFSSDIVSAVFLAATAIMAVIAYKGRDEFIMPRKTIMRMGISRHQQ